MGGAAREEDLTGPYWFLSNPGTSDVLTVTVEHYLSPFNVF